VRELGVALRAKRFTAVELTHGVLARLEKIGPRFNAVVTLTRERALAEARAADGSSPPGATAARSPEFPTA